MTNWLVGHTDRFRSAVTQRSIFNWTSFYGVSDIGPRFTEREVGGPPWADLEALWRQSPLAYAAEVTTPTLVIHAEEDHRCPIEQGEQWYVALKSLGRADTAFLRVPGEGHELSRSGRPDRRIARLDAIVAWFEEHA
jgi:dipeptidyl aminopeptidase/acylaminoacyl peptidase